MSQIKVGVVGAGRIGRMHTENLVRHVPEAEVGAVASPHLDHGWAEGLGIPRRTNDNSAVFDDPAIDAVVITAPSGLHSELICAAAKAGKHIFCEKPVGFEEKPIEDAISAAESAGVRLQVGFNRRFDPDICRLAGDVRDGEVGELHGLRVINRDPSAPPIDFVKRSGGLFFDFAIHDFDTIRFLSGSEIEEIYAAGTVLIDPAIGEAGDIDTAITSIRLSNGALCVIDNSRQARYGYDQRFEAFGTRGNLVVDNTRPTIRESFLEGGVYTDLPPVNFVERYKAAFVAELAAFVGCIREDKPVSVSAEDALAAVRVARAAKLSSDENRPVRLDDAALAGEEGPADE
jgi:myo-inositol 2-dehydrogenase/D-chiro-inositol 1-dehydrogenase